VHKNALNSDLSVIPFNPEDDLEEVIDGFTGADLRTMFFDSVVFARCTECDHLVAVEPDAEDYDCPECDGKGTLTSPLVKLGII
jgi:hypothetical protein